MKFILSILSLAIVAPAFAHDFYLLPEPAAPGPGAEWRIFLHVSDTFPGEAIDWRADKTRAFFLLDAAGRLDLKARVPKGKPLAPRVPLRSPGTTIVALESAPSYIELKASDFLEYLEHEGHDEILQARKKMGQSQAAGRERYTRHVKTLINAGGESPGVSLTDLGLPIEIIPETDPGTVRPGGRLPVRVRFEGEPFARGQLCATHGGYSSKHDAYAWCGRLDEAGRASVPITAPGWQLLRITRMRPLEGDERADWESYWGALTFEVPARGGPVPAAAATATPE